MKKIFVILSTVLLLIVLLIFIIGLAAGSTEQESIVEPVPDKIVGELPVFTITYNENGFNTITPVDEKLYESGTKAGILEPSERTSSGYTFTGWNNKADGSGTTYLPEENILINDENIILYALWEVIPVYSILYDGNGNSKGNTPFTEKKFIENQVIIIASPGKLNKAAYTFSGWNTKRDGKGEKFSAGRKYSMPGEDLFLYAQWTNNPTFNVLYKSDTSVSGITPVDENNYEKGSSVSLFPQGSLIKKGYGFTGWNTKADGSGQTFLKNETIKMGSADITLHAQWEKVYFVIYAANGADKGDVPEDSAGYSEGSTAYIKQAGTIEKVGFSFKGWNTLSDGSGTQFEPGAIININVKDITVFAQWLKSFSLNYYISSPENGILSESSEQYKEGSTVTLKKPETKAPEGRLFSGWNTEQDGRGTMYQPGDNVPIFDNNINLYAQWSFIYFVLYDGNGHTSGKLPVDIKEYKRYDIITAVKRAELNRSGYTFTGWNTKADASGKSYNQSDTFKISINDVTLYAQWLGKDYTITFNANSGSGFMTDQTITCGSAAPLIQNQFYKSKSVFAGWSLSTDGIAEFKDNADFTMIDKNLMLYALWKNADASPDRWFDITESDLEVKITGINYYRDKNTTDIIIPNLISGKPVTEIAEEAFFQNEWISSIIIPDSVKTIGGKAFFECTALKSVTIPNSIITISAWSFVRCNSLTSVSIPSSVTSIGTGAFNDCGSLENIFTESANKKYTDKNGILFSKNESILICYPPGKTESSYTIPPTVKIIDERAFWGSTTLISIIIPDSVNEIKESAFQYCRGLTSISIPDSVTILGKMAFTYCTNLASMKIPSTVTDIGPSIFRFCRNLEQIEVSSSNPNYSSKDGVLFSKDLTNLISYPAKKDDIIYTIPESVSTISPSAFIQAGNLISLTIPDTVKTIGSWAFYHCDGLSSLIIGNGVSFIDNHAFQYCSGLTSVYINSDPPPILGGGTVFDNNDEKRKIYVPEELLEAFQTAEYWDEYSEEIDIQ